MNFDRLFPPGNLVNTCESDNVRLVVNCQTGTGYFCQEADNFLRMKHLSEIDPTATYGLFAPPLPLFQGFAEIFDGVFDFVSLNPQAFFSFRDVALFRRDLTIDIGLSDRKIVPPEDGEYRVLGSGYFTCAVAKSATIEAMLGYWSRRKQSGNYDPWKVRSGLGPQLENLIGGYPDRLALIHIESEANDSTAGGPPAASYFPSLAWLADRGFKLVFIGRDAMPDGFAHFGVINYAQSDSAGVANDYRLMSNAQFALICGSSAAHFPDVLGIPYVYVNSWHYPFIPQPSPHCVAVPALVEELSSGRLLPFSEQAELLISRGPFDSWDFPSENYRSRPAAADEVLSATIDALGGGAQDSPSLLQIRARALDPIGFWRHAGSRYDRSFLEKHQHLIR